LSIKIWHPTSSPNLKSIQYTHLELAFEIFIIFQKRITEKKSATKVTLNYFNGVKNEQEQTTIEIDFAQAIQDNDSVSLGMNKFSKALQSKEFIKEEGFSELTKP
jgi:hypothetical protein